MKERDNGSPTTHTVQDDEQKADLKKARRSLMTRSLTGVGSEPSAEATNVPPDASPGDKSDASRVEITTKEMTLKEALQTFSSELGKPSDTSQFSSPRKRKLAQSMSVYNSVTASIWGEKKDVFSENEIALKSDGTPASATVKAGKNAVNAGKKVVDQVLSEVAFAPIGYGAAKGAIFAAAGVEALTTGESFTEVMKAYDAVLSDLDYPEAVLTELVNHGNLDILGNLTLFLNEVSSNPEVAFIFISTIALAGKVVELVSKNAAENLSINKGSPIYQYEEAIRTQLSYNGGNEKDFTLNNKLNGEIKNVSALSKKLNWPINKLRLTLPFKLATIRSPDISAIQVPQGLAHALSVIRMFAEKGNELDGLEGMFAFKNSAACQAIFSNAETIAKSMETRIDDFAKFAVSVHHAMKGMEYNIFDLTPEQQEKFLRGEMNAGEKKEGKREFKEQFKPEFVQMVVSSGASAWMEMQQRQVMKVALADISKKLENVVITRDEKGKRLSMFDERFRTVDLSEMGRATEVIWTIKAAMKEFDKGEAPSVYAPLYDQLDELHEKINHLTTKHLESGEPLLLSKLPPLLGQWVDQKGEPEAVWNLLLPELEFEPTVDGLAAAHLMRAVTGKVKAKEGAMPDNAMDAEELTKEVAQTAVYDYAHRRGRR